MTLLNIEEADDCCEACCEATATRECHHGSLCEGCYESVHGSTDAVCEGI